VGWEANLPEELNSASRGRRRCHPPRAGAWRIPELFSWEYGWGIKPNCPALLREELTSQSYSHLVKTMSYLTTLHKLVVSYHRPCLVGRRSQLLLTSQPSCETTLEILPLPDGPSDQENQTKKTPSQQDRQHPSPHSPEYQPSEETRTLRNPQS
jgi:hypothetical protein